ncbi:MAG: high-potential iron-sulfur protein [Deltaproteobacteria bacterium]|nr:high-potential iron-sulfur protein [Gammaproteobacteria bacterium]MDP3216058.1 high-potential iron-sulfur protein [Deltaproteobacteria bacterium]
MNETLQPSRRQFLKVGGAAIAMIPVLVISGKAMAAKNAAMRTSMKYQDKPNGDKNCANCMQFVPGKTAKDLGGCKIFAGDTEISPKGYCVAWVAKPK